RRHTRCLSDWSSDVCSSDLMSLPAARLRRRWSWPLPEWAHSNGQVNVTAEQYRPRDVLPLSDRSPPPAGARNRSLREYWHREIQIGRASCRERGGSEVGKGG